MNVYSRTAAIAAFSLILGLSVAACGKKSPAVTPPPPPMPAAPTTPPAPPAPPAPATPPAAPRTLSEDDIFAQKSLAQLNSERPLGDVYFDLDNAVIKDAGKAALGTNATYLKRWPSTRISIEGHCDERGTAEYNLALGERRADAVRNYLTALGISPDRVTVISYGKERPECPEASEGCWSQNRRGVTVASQ
jgi:peptidoglycan-associated lipoprotein